MRIEKESNWVIVVKLRFGTVFAIKGVKSAAVGIFLLLHAIWWQNVLRYEREKKKLYNLNIHHWELEPFERITDQLIRHLFVKE